MVRTAPLLGRILADASKIVETVAFLEGALPQAQQEEDIEVRAEILAVLSRAHMRLASEEQAVARADEALAIAEPRGLERIVAEALVNKGSALSGLRRWREGVALMEAAVGLAHETGDVALELRARNNLASTLGSEDASRSIRVAREAREIAPRLGIRQMSLWLDGTVAWGTIFEGLDWDPALTILDEGIGSAASAVDRVRLLGLKEWILSLRGEDTTAVEDEESALRGAASDPDAEAWGHLFPALRAMLAGDHPLAAERFRLALPLARQTVSDVRVGMMRNAIWSRDPALASEGLAEIEKEPWAGRYVDAEQAWARAAVAALLGREAEASSGFRAAVDGFASAGFRFDQAMTQLDALILLPTDEEARGWAQEARSCFERLRARPFLARLEAALGERVSG